ncbi:conserved hypothetical protein [Burkholderia sp. 8Y]|nr:conserved hypothetical protein [Burkholderia sp. 8Y]
MQRSKVEAQIQQALVMPVPLESSAPHSAITDGDARRLGGMVMLMQGHTNPELRQRFQFTIANPISWDSADNAGQK